MIELMELTIPPAMFKAVKLFWQVVVVPTVVALVVWVGITFTTLPSLIVISSGCLALAGYMLYVSRSSAGRSFHISSDAAKLLATKAQLEHLFAHSPVPYLRIDTTGQVLQGNLAAVRLFAVTLETITQLNLFQHIVTDDDMSTAVIFAKLKSGISVSDLELLIATSASEERWVRMSIYTAGVDTNEYLATLVDITQQKRTDQAKSEFVALAAHQLRTPIAAIRWNLELFASALPSDADPKLRTYMEKVSRNAARMVTLINDFLSVSKLETGTFEADPETVDLTRYIQDIIDEFAAPISQKQLQVQLRTPDTPVTVTADGRLLHIVISNLISNATKYTPNGGAVYVSYEKRGDEIVFSVQDTGIGIPATEQPQLFSKFYRATNARKHRAEGTGLGLYIVKQSAEIMGGSITMQSVEGEGSTFTVTFPSNATTQASVRTPQ